MSDDIYIHKVQVKIMPKTLKVIPFEFGDSLNTATGYNGNHATVVSMLDWQKVFDHGDDRFVDTYGEAREKVSARIDILVRNATRKLAREQALRTLFENVHYEQINKPLKRIEDHLE